MTMKFSAVTYQWLYMFAGEALHAIVQARKGYIDPRSTECSFRGLMRQHSMYFLPRFYMQCILTTYEAGVSTGYLEVVGNEFVVDGYEQVHPEYFSSFKSAFRQAMHRFLNDASIEDYTDFSVTNDEPLVTYCNRVHEHFTENNFKVEGVKRPKTN